MVVNPEPTNYAMRSKRSIASCNHECPNVFSFSNRVWCAYASSVRLSFCETGDRNSVRGVQLLRSDRLQDDGETLQGSGAGGIVGVS